MSELRDQADRTRFAEELDANFCVSAGAGVGKTTAIVDRVANLAANDPAALSRLVVVTYGKAAAEELRVKSRARILAQMGGAAHLRQNLLSDLRRAFFGTIHSFCLQLVRDQGRFLGLPGAVELLEPDAEDEVWERFCESAELDALALPKRALAAASRFLTFDQLLRLGRRIDPLAAETLRARWTDEEAPALAFARALADDGGRSQAKTAENQARLRVWLEEYAAGTDFQELPEFTHGSGTFKKAYAEELAPFAAWLGRAAGRVGADVALAWRDYRLAQGLMTYDDQILWARKLIESPAILRRLRERGHIVILDEAQDTDAAMFAVLTELTRPVSAPAGEWPGDAAAAGPEPGRFCFVGDEQQAIYERANLATYRSYINAFAAGRGGERLEFSVTMRCPGRVIDVVNGLFAGQRQAHVEFRELHARPGCASGAAWRVPIAAADAEAKVDARFQAECEQVARFLLEKQPAGLGARGWGEVAILCPRHKWLAMAAMTFAAHGLPCRLVAERKLEMEMARHSWPAALLHVLANPWDRFELIGVLREVFAVSDVELAEAHAANGRLDLHSRKGLSPRLEQALELLRAARADVESALAGEGTLSGMVEQVFARVGLAGRLEAIGDSAACLESFHFQAMQAECDGVSLRDFAAQACCGLRRAAEGMAEAGDEIQILTCMKAKGLEWPVVIPMGLCRKISEEPPAWPRIVTGADGVEIHLGAATIGDEWKAARDLARREELHRVFYVTMTRAKQLVVWPDAFANQKLDPSTFHAISRAQALDSLLDQPSLLAPPAGQAVSVQPAAHVAPVAALVAEAAARSRAIPRRILPHELAHDPRAALDDAPQESFADVGGLDYGTWWHAAMQHFPWSGDRAGYIERTSRETPPLLLRRAARELRVWMESALLADLLAAGKSFVSEAPFSHPRSAAEWMEGVIDLVVVTQSGDLWIVDWKTDRRQSGETEKQLGARISSRYLPQLEAYAEVLEQGMKRRVERLILYSTELGAPVE